MSSNARSEGRVDATYAAMLVVAGVVFLGLGGQQTPFLAGGLTYLVLAISFLAKRATTTPRDVAPDDYIAPRNWPWRRLSAIAPVAVTIGIWVGRDWAANGPSPSDFAILALFVGAGAYLIYTSMKLVDRVVIREQILEIELPFGRHVSAPWSSVAEVRGPSPREDTTIRLADGRTFLLSREFANYERLREQLLLRSGDSRA